jgi:hypothetical protein
MSATKFVRVLEEQEVGGAYSRWLPRQSRRRGAARLAEDTYRPLTADRASSTICPRRAQCDIAGVDSRACDVVVCDCQPC